MSYAFNVRKVKTQVPMGIILGCALGLSSGGCGVSSPRSQAGQAASAVDPDSAMNDGEIAAEDHPSEGSDSRRSEDVAPGETPAEETRQEQPVDLDSLTDDELSNLNTNGWEVVAESSADEQEPLAEHLLGPPLVKGFFRALSDSEVSIAAAEEIMNQLWTNRPIGIMNGYWVMPIDLTGVYVHPFVEEAVLAEAELHSDPGGLVNITPSLVKADTNSRFAPSDFTLPDTQLPDLAEPIIADDDLVVEIPDWVVISQPIDDWVVVPDLQTDILVDKMAEAVTTRLGSDLEALLDDDVTVAVGVALVDVAVAVEMGLPLGDLAEMVHENAFRFQPNGMTGTGILVALDLGASSPVVAAVLWDWLNGDQPIDHPNADPDGDGLPNATDDDDDGDGVLDWNDSYPYDAQYQTQEAWESAGNSDETIFPCDNNACETFAGKFGPQIVQAIQQIVGDLAEGKMATGALPILDADMYSVSLAFPIDTTLAELAGSIGHLPSISFGGGTDVEPIPYRCKSGLCQCFGKADCDDMLANACYHPNHKDYTRCNDTGTECVCGGAKPTVVTP